MGLTCAGSKSHPCPFEKGLYDHLIGAFDHARANGPALLLLDWILEQRHALTKIVHLLLHGLKLCESNR
jgi:hypothetical protein